MFEAYVTDDPRAEVDRVLRLGAIRVHWDLYGEKFRSVGHIRRWLNENGADMETSYIPLKQLTAITATVKGKTFAFVEPYFSEGLK